MYRGFEDIAAYCSTYTSSVPIILLLGFFTSTSMQVSYPTLFCLINVVLHFTVPPIAMVFIGKFNAGNDQGYSYFRHDDQRRSSGSK